MKVDVIAIFVIFQMIGLIIGVTFVGCFFLVSIGVATWEPHFDSIITRFLIIYSVLSFISLFYIIYKYKQEKHEKGF